MPSVPFYENWTFWTAIVAGLALILSQLPPLREIIKGAKLDLDVYSRIAITHKVGNPNILLHLILSNIGGRSVKIRSVTAVIKRENRVVGTLPAQTYVKNPSDTKSTIPFVSFSLRPKEDWAYPINLLKFFSRENEKKYREAESKIRERIIQMRALLENKDQVVEAEDLYVRPFFELYNELFIWQAGEFEMQVRVETDPDKAAVQKTYRFTLFESDSNILANHKEFYKTGEGINWPGEHTIGVAIELIEVR